MALSVQEVSYDKSPDVWGRWRVKAFVVTLDDDFDSPEALPKSAFGFVDVLAAFVVGPTGGYVFAYDPVSEALEAYMQTDSDDDVPLGAVTNKDMSSVPGTVTLLVIGR